MEAQTIANWIQFFALLIALGAVFWQTRANNKQARLENFARFTERYQNIALNLPTNIESKNFNLASLERQERELLLRWMRAYFDLCSEEFYLYQKGYLEEEVWSLWKGGMKDSFRRPAFREGWQIIQTDGYYASEFSDFVDLVHRY